MISLLLWAALLQAPAAAATPAEPAPTARDQALADQAAQLVRQLDASELADRDEAEKQLLALGVGVLPYLPNSTDRLGPEAARRLNNVRQELLRAQAHSAAQPTFVTLKGDKLPLADVFKAMSEQTGNPIVDHREAFGQQVVPITVTVNFDKTPFWRALDNVLDQAGLSLYGFAGERGIHVVGRLPEAGNRAAKASYSGAFRLDPVRFDAQRDLRNDKLGALKFYMDVEWEPRLRPFAVMQPLATVSAVDDQGRAVNVSAQAAQSEALVRGSLATVELEVPFDLAQPGAQRIAKLKGQLKALVPGPFSEFKFDEVPSAVKGAKPKAIELRQGGTSVTIESVRKNNELWEVALKIKYEAPAAAMESHRSWIQENQAFFEDAQGNREESGGLEQTRQGRDELGINYFFDLPKGPEGLKFIYRTPLVILEVPIDFEFSELRLP